ncbi:acetyl esterase/lipase [Herbihabitans rhizosphaerae]|uniref:Acetyl esterase/lipase n=1 Tax=Herbihabitans rhizosphaerae TaxID=1872711 RepID=A0A4Q7KMI3_9PSEU|nr:alpha/beta hydrolase [Herbihabitans rhizosphaerae]RZS37889.1 acetyl esterase/lipase [Herbihabitans rhizosphaerae]
MTALPSSPSLESRALAMLLSPSLRVLLENAPYNGLTRRLVREAFDRFGGGPVPRGATIRPIAETFDDNPVRGLWITAREADPAAGVMLYLHGGGYVFGSPNSHRRHAVRMSATSGLPVLSLDYRKAPEHPFPAAPDDALTAYQWLLARGYAPSQIVVAGDSAGGHLAATLLGDLSRKRMPMPAAAVFLSPWTDLTCAELPDRDKECRDPYIPPSRALECAIGYAGDTPMTHPRLNVLSSNKRRWPPTLIQVGARECLLGDSERLAKSISDAGAPVELQVWPGQVHVFQALAPLISEGRAAMRYVGEFLGKVLEPAVAATA